MAVMESYVSIEISRGSGMKVVYFRKYIYREYKVYFSNTILQAFDKYLYLRQYVIRVKFLG